VPFLKTSILIGWNQSSIFHLEFQNYFTLSNLRVKWGGINLTRNDMVANRIVTDIFSNHMKFSLILKGTPFETRVWTNLSNLNITKLIAYSDLSTEIFGNTKYARAIGSALARNSIAYLIPCHLVCSKYNKIMNYKWGTEMKRKLIDYDLNQK
jgi:AraC family transcriptional regulator of adaptative response/methylated-DNA-[protein]-cysteine methyltransferase